MKYALLIYPGRSMEEYERMSEEERQSILGEYDALLQEPGVFGAEQLQPPESATTVRVEDGRTLTTDGPFADTKEILGGLYLLEADNLDRALELAARIPAARHGRRGRGAAAGGAVALLEQVFREEWGRVLANLIGFLGDFDLAEEAAQEAFAIAAERWPRTGEPANPGAWLTTTARNRAIDRIRRDRTLAAKTRLLELPEAVESGDGGADVPRRAAGADLHLLSSGAGAGGAGGVDAAHARWLDDRGDRARLPRLRRRR